MRDTIYTKEINNIRTIYSRFYFYFVIATTMARKTRMRKRTHKNRTYKHRRTCKCKRCCSKRRSGTRSRRGGNQTAVDGNMTFQRGQWVSLNPLGGRS